MTDLGILARDSVARRLDRDLLRERRKALAANVVRDDVVSVDLEAG